MLCGPRTELPVALSKTWKPSLTICRYCVSPTSPLVSGGAQLQPTPGNWMPLKLRIGLGISGVGAFVCWMTGSGLSVCDRYSIDGIFVRSLVRFLVLRRIDSRAGR